MVGEVNKYLTVTEPYKMKDESQRERLGTVLHVAAQCVLDCNTMLSPFLPHSANKVWHGARRRGRVHADAADRARRGARPRQRRRAARLPGHHRRLLRDARAGSPGRSTVGAKVEKPTPIFTKLDPSVVDEELARAASLEQPRPT